MTSPYTTSLTVELFLQYLEEVQNLTVRGDRENRNMISEIAELIQEQLNQIDETDGSHTFLKGEEAFYQGRYKRALESYLSAKDIPNFHFFCYRASAFVSEELGRSSKAISFLRKALAIYPTDYTCLKLLASLLEQTDQHQEAAEIRTQLDQMINGDIQYPEQEDLEQSRAVGLGDEELNELSNLFAEHTEESSPMIDENEQNESTAVLEATHTEATYSTEAAEEMREATEESSQAISQLKALAESGYGIASESTDRFVSENLGVGVDAGYSLEERIRLFQRTQVDAMSSYVENSMHRQWQSENVLCVLSGWSESEENEANNSKTTLTQALLPATYRQTTGGIFLRWNGKGIAVNPGKDFLRNFHARGLHIKDIDSVVITRGDKDAYADVKAIYDLNYGFNKMSSDLHIIHYYLNQQAHRAIAPNLKPHFKQERNTVHSLDLYVDSPEIESINLADDIALEYFPAFTSTAQGDTTRATESTAAPIGIRLTLQMNELMRVNNDGKSQVRVGYLSGAGYSPVAATSLSECDLLVTGFEGTNNHDYNKLKYNETSLGYFGTYSLLEEVAPRLLVFTEFNGQDGDIRVEVAKKLRQEYAYSSHHNSVVMPGDSGLVVDLENQRVQCSVSKTFVDPSQIRITKTRDTFGNLEYLSPNCII